MSTEMVSTSQMEGVPGRIYPYLGSAFLISMGYFDLAKWATVIEGGSRFGFELVWLLILSNVVSILCQSLAARIGLVTGKHLAQVYFFVMIFLVFASVRLTIGAFLLAYHMEKICAEEYPRPVCLLLWLQCEASVLALNLTMILGTAIVFNLLLDMDMHVCVMLSTVDIFLFPILLPHLGKRRAEVLAVIIAGLMLIFFVLDTISTEQNVAFIMNGMLPIVRRESLYMSVGLLGASIMPHNFYLHSSAVQEQKLETIPIGTLCHYNFLEIAVALSGILLVNLALLSSAATTFHIAGLEVLTYQDAQPLIEQVFKSPIPLVVFFVGIYCASQLSTVTGTIGAQVALEGFLGVHPHIWVHRVLIKVGAVVLAMLCIWNTDAAGIYQLLIFSQVMLAMQLPSAVIPLFRVASSSSIMGTHRVPFAVEVMAWLSFFFMLILNLSLVLEMCFWDSDWIWSLRWNIGTGRVVPFTLVLMVAGMSFVLMLWLITTPLKSANEKPENHPLSDESIILHEHFEHPSLKHTDTEATKSEDISRALELSVNKESRTDEPLAETDIRISSEENAAPVLEGRIFSSEHDPKIDLENVVAVREGRISSSEHDPKIDLLQPSDARSNTEFLSPNFSASSNSVGIESSSVKILGATSDSLSTEILSNVVKSSTGASEMSTSKEGEMEADVELEKDDDDDAWEHEDVLMDISESVSSVTYEEPGSGRSVGGRSDDGGSGNGSLSRLSGLGRAARRQFASILDEFWGKLFDFHGKPTKQAILKRLDLALGMKASQPRENVSSSVPLAREPNYVREQQRMLWQKGNMSECSSHADSCMQRGEHFSGVHSSMGNSTCGVSSAAWPPTLLQDPYTSQAIPNFSLSERRYSSLHLPVYRKEVDYQPVTIHGYQMASYMGQSGTLMEGDDTICSNIEPQAGAGSCYPTCIDNSMNNVTVGSGIDEFWGSHIPNTGYKSHALQGGQSAYDKSISSRSLLRSHENSSHTGQTKKYHSLPDIYDRGISQCNPPVGQKEDQWNPLVNRVTGELDMRYGLGSPSHRRGFTQMPVSRTAPCNDRKDPWGRQTPLAFDELSPSQLHKDAFSLQSNSNAENNSLWSRQPFEQLFGMPRTGSGGLYDSDRSSNPRNISTRTLPSVDSEVEMLQSLRVCIAKLLKLDGSEWLFGLHQNGGLDEELIGLVASREQFLRDADVSESYRLYNSDAQNQRLNHKYGSSSTESSVPHCGEGCVWESGLVVSFGVWCIHRILELSLMESRPELWGKYTYVLNRLQGILDSAFFRPRHVLPRCFCLDMPFPADMSGRSANTCQSISQTRSGNIQGKGASASVFLEIIKDVESAVASRKGRTGTAAGDVAFPKGKENLASVLKRYKRRLANKQGVLESSGGSRKVF